MEDKKLQKSARRLRWLVWIAIATIAAVYCVARLKIDLGPFLVVKDHTVGSRTGAYWISDLSTGFFLFSLFQLTRMLSWIAAGELFTPNVTRALRNFALWLLLSVLVSILGAPLAKLLTENRSGHDVIELTADVRDIFYFITTLVLFLVARVLESAAQIDAELREIV